jgi:hypothetical protein
MGAQQWEQCVASVQQGEVIHMQSVLSLFPKWFSSSNLQQIKFSYLFLGLFNEVFCSLLQTNLEAHVPILPYMLWQHY